MKRFVAPALFGAALMASGAFAQNADPKVTYESVAVPLKTAVAAIAQKAGAKLEVAPSVGNEFVIVRLVDAPLSATLSRLADVTGCEWQAPDPSGVRRLVRSPETIRREQKEEIALKTRQIAAALKGLAKKLEDAQAPKKDGGPNVAEAFGSPWNSSIATPTGKAIAKLSAFLDPATLATIGDGRRIVYSTDANRMQLRLAQRHDRVLQELARDQAEYAKRFQAAMKGEAKEQMAQFEPMAKAMGIRLTPDTIDRKPAKALMVASRGGIMGMFGGDSITLDLRVYDADGRVMLSGSMPLGLDPLAKFIEQYTKPQPVEKGTPIQFSPLTTEYSTFLNMANPAAMMEQKPSPELLETLLRPDLHDPLSLAPSDSVLAVAKAKNVNLVANLPDDVVSPITAMALMGKAAPTVEGYLAELQSGEKTTVEIKDGWMVVKPSRPVEARRTRVDREALARFIARARETETPSLEDLADYAFHSLPPTSTPISMPYLVYSAPSALGGGMSGLQDWDMLRFYGSLSPAQRRQLGSGDALPFRELARSQRDLIARMAFGTNARLIVESPNSKTASDDGGFFAMVGKFMPKTHADYRDEPTEAMPNGLPVDGAVVVKSTPGSFVTVAGPDGTTNRMYGAMGPDELGMIQYLREEPALAQAAALMPKFDRFRVGDRTTLEFNFMLMPGISIQHTLNNDLMGKNAPLVSLEQFPADFTARMNKRVKAMKASPFPITPEMMGAGRAHP